MKHEVTVFLDNEKRVNKTFNDAKSAKEYSSAILKNGLIHDRGHRIELYPPQRILMVRVDDLDAIAKMKKAK